MNIISILRYFVKKTSKTFKKIQKILHQNFLVKLSLVIYPRGYESLYQFLRRNLAECLAVEVVAVGAAADADLVVDLVVDRAVGVVDPAVGVVDLVVGVVGPAVAGAGPAVAGAGLAVAGAVPAVAGAVPAAEVAVAAAVENFQLRWRFCNYYVGVIHNYCRKNCLGDRTSWIPSFVMLRIKCAEFICIFCSF